MADAWLDLRQLSVLLLVLRVASSADTAFDLNIFPGINSTKSDVYSDHDNKGPVFNNQPLQSIAELNHPEAWHWPQEALSRRDQHSVSSRRHGSLLPAFGSRRRILRLAVFGDATLVDHLAFLNPENPLAATHKFITTEVSAIETLIQEATGDELTLQIQLVHIGIWSETSAQPVQKQDVVGGTLFHFCNWASKRNAAKGSPGHWHHAILLTGKELYSTTHETLGSTFLGGACYPERACSLMEAKSFKVVYIAAHEVAHSLGVPHDGKEGADSCPSVGFIMGEALTEQSFKWSNCSKKTFKQILLESQCLETESQGSDAILGQTVPTGSFGTNVLPARFTELDHTIGGLPGQRYTADSQCQLGFGSDYRAIPSRKNVCEHLTCSNGVIIRGAHPALAGTSCGDNLVCSAGSCSGRFNPPTPTIPPTSFPWRPSNVPTVPPNCPNVVSKPVTPPTSWPFPPNINIPGNIFPNSLFPYQVLDIPLEVRCALLPVFLHESFGCLKSNAALDNSLFQSAMETMPQTPGHHLSKNASGETLIPFKTAPLASISTVNQPLPSREIEETNSSSERYQQTESRKESQMPVVDVDVVHPSINNTIGNSDSGAEDDFDKVLMENLGTQIMDNDVNESNRSDTASVTKLVSANLVRDDESGDGMPDNSETRLAIGNKTLKASGDHDERTRQTSKEDGNTVLSLRDFSIEGSGLQLTLPEHILGQLLNPPLKQASLVDNDREKNDSKDEAEGIQADGSTDYHGLVFVRSGQPQEPLQLALTASSYLHTTRVTPCTKSCGSGTRVTSQICVEITDLGKEVPYSYCDGLPNSRPRTTEACNTFACQTPKWVVGYWGPCSQWCDVGVQHRMVSCAVPLLHSGSPNAAALYLHQRKCEQQKPQKSRLCHGACLQVDCNAARNKFHPGCLHLLPDLELEKDQTEESPDYFPI